MHYVDLLRMATAHRFRRKLHRAGPYTNIFSNFVFIVPSKSSCFGCCEMQCSMAYRGLVHGCMADRENMKTEFASKHSQMFTIQMQM